MKMILKKSSISLTKELEVIQYTGRNGREVREWSDGQVTERDNSDVPYLEFIASNGLDYCNRYEYLIKDPNNKNRFECLSNSLMKKYYQEEEYAEV